MKPEQLKDKEGYVDSWNIRDKQDTHISHRTKVFEDKDIKSAVTYLKEACFYDDKVTRTSFQAVIKNIDKAFEDVIN